uniref:hybrid sensor histidine kinase/response regulator n=1 Tax=Prevotella sp. TaxID=59823 RepID=UPI0040291DFB
MHKNNIPVKVSIGYAAVAIIMVLAIALVYGNTKSIIAINQASKEYIAKKNTADSTMTSLLKEEQENLRQLSDAMAGKPDKNYLREKVNSLNMGKDSVVVHSKAPQTHEAKSTTVEVVKTRKGFFRRLADAFKKEHAETLSVKKDSDMAVVDTVVTPVNVAENVADILQQIEKKENHEKRSHADNMNKEVEDLKVVSTQLALRSAKQLSDVHQKERGAMQRAISQAMEARRDLLWQMGLLAIVTIAAVMVLIVVIWRDSKKEREYQESLEAANEEIQCVMNQRERLLLTITHDIKAPAASIAGFIDLMGDYVSSRKGMECLHNIKNSAVHLSHLVASLLDYHQLENGLMKVRPTTFSLVRLVAECVEGMRLRAEEKGLRLSYDTTKAEGLFLADAFRIRQILDNLVGNAIKYTDCGGVTVKALVSKAMGKHQLTLSVKDTGKGMTTEDKRKVFQAFARLGNAQGIEGAGLGLSITKELVALLDGEIHVNSTVGKGSIFTVTIPVEPSKEETTKKDARKAFANHKILILDDDKLQLQLIQEMLRRIVDDSWRVFACGHVVDALTTLHNERPALMLMDIEMPEMNGTEMIRHVNHAQMTVVAMTAHDNSIKGQLLEAGFDDCLFKPFGIDQLARILGKEAKGQVVADDTTPTDGPSSRFDSLVAFAGGDEDAAREIVSTVKEELARHLSDLKEMRESAILPVENIGKVAHKLLPIASMTRMESVEALTALSPERIHGIGEGQIREYLKMVINELQDILAHDL